MSPSRSTSRTLARKRRTPPRRLTQRWFEVRASSIHGLGAFAVRRIPEGTRIIEYTGERITPAEAGERYDDDAMEHAHTFLFTVDDETVIDAARGGNEARFINHSCEPNCETVDEDGRIFLYALRDIASGGELTYDYHLERSGRLPDGWRCLYACHCGTPSCRGTLLARTPRRRRSGKASGLVQRIERSGTYRKPRRRVHARERPDSGA